MPEIDPHSEITYPALYLESLKITNFRVFDKAGRLINFKPGLNVIIGENNSGKSAAIDALRYIFNLGSFQRRDDLIKIDDQDIHRDGVALSNEEIIEFEAHFASKDEAVAAQLNDLYAEKRDDTFVFMLNHKVTMKHSRDEGRHIYKTSSTMGGLGLDNPVSSETLDYIRSVYLSPLRDIIADSKKVGLEIEKLIRSQVNNDEDVKKLDALPTALRTKVIDAIHEITGDSYISVVGQSLLDYSKPYLMGDPASLVTFSPNNINRNLYRTMQPLFNHKEHGENGLDLEANGLGLNNLIYASIVLSRKKHNEEFRFFLIEEPEAHLHPQILRTFFSELNAIQDHQVFVTSHSAMITAEVDLTRVVLFKRFNDGTPEITHLASIYGGDVRQANRKYLHKFLDTTKSQLLFSRGAIFVEGISEALLLNKFADILGKNLRTSGVEIVMLGAKGGFNHFAPLFKASPSWKCAFITDNDCSVDDITKSQPTIPRDSDATPRTYMGIGTFEYELLRTAKEKDDGETDPTRRYRVAKLQSAFSKACTNGSKTFFDEDNLALSYKRMKNKATPDEWGSEGLKTNSNFEKSKSEFSFQLEELLTADDKDMVPRYIVLAIEYVTGKIVDDSIEPTPETDAVEQ